MPKKKAEKKKEASEESEEEPPKTEVSLTKKEAKKLDLRKKQVDDLTLQLGNLYISRLSLIQRFDLQQQQIIARLNQANGSYAQMISNLKFKYDVPDEENWFYRSGKLVKGPETII